MEAQLMTDSDTFWPYILPMPTNYEHRIRFIRDVLASRVASSVLGQFEESGSVLQRDLIRGLSHSNKSIIHYLEVLRSYGLIQTGSRVNNGKRVVYHELTGMGESLVHFFSEHLPTNVGDLTESLLEDYLTSLLSFYRAHDLEESIFYEILARVRARTIVEGSIQYDHPDFMIVGASALFTSIDCEELTDSVADISCRMPRYSAGGPSLELASHLADRKSQSVFVSSIGDDLNGWRILNSLLSKGVDVTHFVIESEKHTNETIVINDGLVIRKLVGIDEGFSLSITSPSQIPWIVLKESRMVYIGEVFLEVGLAIAAYCKANGIPCVFRCSQHYWKLGVSRIKSLLNQIDVLLISPQEWEIAQHELGSNPMAALRSHTQAEILIKMSKETYGVMKEGSESLLTLTKQGRSIDLDPLFVARFLSAYQDVRDAEKALRACISEN
jgi:sugar/nucleoside kinase (ribokinase family)